LNVKMEDMNVTEEQKDTVIYQSVDGEIEFNVNVFDETVWLTQKQIGKLFDKDVRTISEHINNCYEEGEVICDATIRKFRIVQKEGSRSIKRNVEHYSLDTVISVGYRVKSKRGIQFRKWANKVLKQHMLNGYSINATRLHQIESALNELLRKNDLAEENTEDIKIVKEDISVIKNTLLKLIERPININIQNTITNSKVEDKLIELLDQMINSVEKEEIKNELVMIQKDVKRSPLNQPEKNRVVAFFASVGDKDSSLHKAIKGAGITQRIMNELVDLGKKVYGLF
jgi:hypothetical protein